MKGGEGKKGLRVARDLFWDPRPGPCVQWAFCGTGRARKPQGITVQPPTLHETQPRALAGNGGEGRCEEEGGGSEEAEEEEPQVGEKQLKVSFFNA